MTIEASDSSSSHIICAKYDECSKTIKYINTTEVILIEDIANVVFMHSPGDIPESVKKKITKNIKSRVKQRGKRRFFFKKKPTTETGNQIEWFNKSESSLKPEVTRVAINLHLPVSEAPFVNDNAINKSDQIWFDFIPIVAEVCLQRFPNLRPEYSNFNVHFASTTYHAERLLLPGMARTGRICLSPKS